MYEPFCAVCATFKGMDGQMELYCNSKNKNKKKILRGNGGWRNLRLNNKKVHLLALSCLLYAVQCSDMDHLLWWWKSLNSLFFGNRHVYYFCPVYWAVVDKLNLQSCWRKSKCGMLLRKAFYRPSPAAPFRFVTALVTIGNSLQCRGQREPEGWDLPLNLPCVQPHKTHWPCWFTDKNKVRFCRTQCWCEMRLQRESSLFTSVLISQR